MWKKLMWFASGLVIGSVGGYFTAKYIIEEKALAETKKQVEQVKEYYEAKANAQIKAAELNVLKEKYAETKVMEAQIEAEKQAKFDYSRVSEAAKEKPYDEGDEWGDAKKPKGAPRSKHNPFYEEEGGVTIYPTEPNDEIRMISDQAFTDEKREYEKMTIFWFMRDNVVTDEEYSPLEDESILGNEWRDQFGTEEDPDVVHVRNPKIACDYEIIRQDRAYATTIPD